MAKVPDGADINTWEAEGNVWFKTASLVADHGEGFGGDNSPVWPSLSMVSLIYTILSDANFWCHVGQAHVGFKVPKSLPNGYYLVRVEGVNIIAEPAQFYVACGQVLITGGGNGTPGPLVAFPGAYKSNEPGLRNTIDGQFDPKWKPAGPPVWQG
jgi:hypothetical protein